MKELLKDYPKEQVSIFVSYLKKLESEIKDGKKVNWWFGKIEKDEFADAFKKVASQGLFIDGDTITLNYRKKLLITYDYHAYMNRILILYPETKFDFGLVHKGDTFTLRKESGKVIYKHEILNPFASNEDIIGAYGIIKNTKGEFVETLNLNDIAKMKQSSMMTYIWDKWYDRMVLKSVIKRICTIHFKDEIKIIDNEDNEMNDPNKAKPEKPTKPELPKEKYTEAIKGLINGMTIEKIETKYKISNEIKEYLINEASKSL